MCSKLPIFLPFQKINKLFLGTNPVLPHSCIPGSLAGSRLLLPMLLLLLWAAAITQVHWRSGTYISTVQKGGFLFIGLSDDEDDFNPHAKSMLSSSIATSLPTSLPGVQQCCLTDPSPRASWPLPWPWSALQRAVVTHQFLSPRAISQGLQRYPPLFSEGCSLRMISSAKLYSVPCKILGGPAFIC